MRDKLAALDADAMATANINMNSLSDAPSVQLILEQHLEKKSGALPPCAQRSAQGKGNGPGCKCGSSCEQHCATPTEHMLSLCS